MENDTPDVRDDGPIRDRERMWRARPADEKAPPVRSEEDEEQEDAEQEDAERRRPPEQGTAHLQMMLHGAGVQAPDPPPRSEPPPEG